MVRLSSSPLALVGALFLSSISTTTAENDAIPTSGFSASDGSVSFALNIPKDGDNDLYFSLQADASQSWVSIGMGSEKMDDSLMWMVYKDKSGKNLTLSPRLSYGHVEPSYESTISVTTLAGTGIIDGNYTVFARCSNCRSWKGGSIDPTNTKANFIFAGGPSGDLNTNDKSAGIKRHSLYGVFHMDLTAATGPAGVPAIVTANTAGTTEAEDKSDHDFSSAAHACIMILAFVGLMPLGFLILRVMNSVKWHAVNQGISAVVALIGSAIGVYIGSQYNRSKNWNSAHQIFGVIIIVAMIGQFVLGFLHHRIYKKTQATTKMAPIHVWLGRIVIPAGIANGFLGFPLAMNSKFNWVLLSLTLLVIVVILPFTFWRMKRNNDKRQQPEAAGGYQARPWETHATQHSDSDGNVNLNPYPQPSGQVYPPLPAYSNEAPPQQYQGYR